MHFNNCYCDCYWSSRHTMLILEFLNKFEEYLSHSGQTFHTSCGGISNELFPDETWRLLTNRTWHSHSLTKFYNSSKLFCHIGSAEDWSGGVCILYSSPKWIFWYSFRLIPTLCPFFFFNYFLICKWNSPEKSQRWTSGQAHALVILLSSVVLWTAYAFPLLHPNLLLDWLKLLLSTLCWGCL